MNWDTIEGQWQQVKGSLKSQWGKLTDQDLMVLKGQKDMILGALQEKYGVTKEQAQQQVEAWMKTQTKDA